MDKKTAPVGMTEVPCYRRILLDDGNMNTRIVPCV